MPKPRTRKPTPPFDPADQGKQTAPTYRVWKLDAELKVAMASKREARNQTVREFVNESIIDELPDLVSSLSKLGVDNSNPTLSPIRCPMEDATLSLLRRATQATGLDQFQLFSACLRLATRRKRRRGRSGKTSSGRKAAGQT